MRVRTGSKWKVQDAVERAESSISLIELTESGQYSKAGLGLIPKEKVPAKGSKEYRKLVTNMVKKEEDECLYTMAIQQAIQGRWTQWKEFIQKDLRWKSLLAAPPSLTSFCMGATYGTLACPTKLKRWGLSTDSKCELCGKDGAGVKHIFSGCSNGLGQGRYRYRHNEVLRCLTQFIQRQVAVCKEEKRGRRRLILLKKGRNQKQAKKR